MSLKAARRARLGAGASGGTPPPSVDRSSGLPSILDTYTGGYDSTKYATMQGTASGGRLTLAGGQRFDSHSITPTGFTSAYIEWTTGGQGQYRVYRNNFADWVDCVIDAANSRFILEDRIGGVLSGTQTFVSWATEFAARQAFVKIENTGANWVWSIVAGTTPPALGSWPAARKTQALQGTVDTTTTNARVNIAALTGQTIVVDDLGVYY